MPDAPAKAKTPPSKSSGGFMRFLEAPGPFNLPWIVWGGVLAGVAVIIVLWYRNQQSNAQGNTSATGTGTTSTTDNGSANALGLAIDPTTGLPYAVEGLVPSGGTVGSGDPYAQEINQLQQEIAALQAGTTPPPSTTTTGSGGTTTTTTTTVGGGTITASGSQSLETIAEHAYGFADNSSQLAAAIAAIIAANTGFSGDSGSTKPKKGTVVTIPTVNQSTGAKV